MAIEAIPNCCMIQVDKPATKPVARAQVAIPAEKVGCTFVTNNLQKYLNEYPQLSDSQVFLDNHHMLTLLDHYLYDNPRQYIHCMSYNTECVTLLNHAICSKLDTSSFLTVWSVLSILLNT